MARFTGSAGFTPTVANPFVSGPLTADLADSITGMVFCDVAGTLFVEQSADAGKNWDVSTSYPIVANDGSGFKEDLVGPWYQIRFVPSADASVFRLAARTSSAGSR
jgi:hypothetical protein